MSESTNADQIALPTQTTVEQDGFSITSTDSQAQIEAALARAEVTSDTPAPAPEPESEPAPEPALPEEPAADEPPPAPDRPRDDSGKFKKLTGKARQQQIQAEIDRATWERHQEERRLEELRLQRAQLEAETERLRQPAAAPAATNGKPKADDIGTKFQTYEDYVEALTDWKAQQTFASARQQWQVEQQQAYARQQQEQAFSQHQTRITAAKAKYADWDQVAQQATEAVVKAGLPELPPVLAYALLQSDQGPDILHYLGTHPEELIQLSMEHLRTPVDAAPLMRQYLEQRIAAVPRGPASPPVRSSAPPPIQPLGSAPVRSATNYDELEFGPEYVRIQNELERKRSRR